MKPKTSTLRVLYEHISKADECLDRVPDEISDAIFDNPYINGYYRALEEIIKIHFGEEHWYSVDWFLTEWKEGLGVRSPCGVDLNINSIDEYCDYLIKYEGWEK